MLPLDPSKSVLSYLITLAGSAVSLQPRGNTCQVRKAGNRNSCLKLFLYQQTSQAEEDLSENHFSMIQ